MKLEVRNAKAEDLHEIKRLTDEYISEDYYSLDALEGMLHGDRNLFYVVTDAEKGDAVISYFYAFLAELDEALQILHVPEKPEALRTYPGDTLVAVCKASGTEKAYRKHGICSSFVLDQEPVVRSRGAKLILATALHPVGREVPMRHIFLDNGFTAVEDICRPWANVRGYCPYCKQEYCVCDAVFYIKKTEDEEVHE